MDTLEVMRWITYPIIVLTMTFLATPMIEQRNAKIKELGMSRKEKLLFDFRTAVVYVGAGLLFFGGAALTHPAVAGPLSAAIDPQNSRMVGLFMSGGAVYIVVHILMQLADRRAMHVMLVLTVLLSILFAAIDDSHSKTKVSLEIELALAGGILLDYILKFFEWIYPSLKPKAEK